LIYFDTSYVVRLYFEDPGWQEVRELAAGDHIACCLLGYVETVAAFHRKFRERVIDDKDLKTLLGEFHRESEAGAFQWLPLSEAVGSRVRGACAHLPRQVCLRAGDAIHLACAAENGFREVHSNDRNLLAAARHFGLRGVDLI
jgi:predicted nucleic acid-binding protein